MPVRLSLTLVILIVCTTWNARAQSVPQMTKVSFQNTTALNVSVWSVDPTSGQESLIGNVPAGGAISGDAVPGMELRVRLGGLGGGGALIVTYVTPAAYTQDVKIAMRGNEVLLEPGYADYWGPHGPTGKPVTDSPDCSRDVRSCVQPIPASSFAGSCKNIRVTASRVEPPTLYAECRRADGSLNHSSILIKGITNLGGRLYFEGMDKPSSFQGSCINIRIAYTGSTLEAECQTADGRFIPTYTPIPGIANNNGVLAYQ
jgi:hypothetical protein